MSDFVFRSEDHSYWIGDKQLPSVTQIISPLVDYSKVPPGKLEHKRNLGTAFHEAIKLYLHHDLDEESLDEQLNIPMRQFKEWFEDDEFKDIPSPAIIAIEKPFYSEKLKYAGTPDLVTEDAIYDFKLRKYNPVADSLQLAGYAGLISDFPQKRKIVVEFSLEGGYRIYDAEKKQSWPFFRLLLERFHKNREWDLKIEQWRKSI